MDTRGDWSPVVDLIERVVSDDALLPAVVTGVRSMVREVGVLPPADIAGQTRALLAAATRAIAERRPPTEAELSFVAELGVTRARQGVPVEAVLGAIHVAERAIWSRAREVAGREGLPADLLLDARELYDDWSELVRARLIAAHRATTADGSRADADRDAVVLRRLLAGGSAAGLAAAEAGLPGRTGLWLLVARPEAEHVVRGHGPVLCALLEGLVVGVLTRPPSGRDGAPAGLAGPAEPEELGVVRRLAGAALVAAEATGRAGVTHVGDVATLAALTDRADLAAVLLERQREARAALGSAAEQVAGTVCGWLAADRDVVATAEALFVHPNTVRNRVQRFADLTGIDPHGTFGGLDAWWLCRSWLSHQD